MAKKKKERSVLVSFDDKRGVSVAAEEVQVPHSSHDLKTIPVTGDN